MGAGIVLKKTGKETSDIIENQINEIARIRENFLHEMSRINIEMEKLIAEVSG